MKMVAVALLVSTLVMVPLAGNAQDAAAGYPGKPVRALGD